MGERERRRIHTTSLRSSIREHKALFAVYVLLRLSVILILATQIAGGEWENAFYCILALVLMFVPSFIENNWHIDIPDTLEIIVLLFIYAAEILGELRAYYISIPFWDTMLHTITGFLAAAVGFSLCDIFNRNENIKFSLSPFFLAFVAFCFSMTVAVCWEFFEFSADQLLGSDMQKDTVIHTINTVELDVTHSNRVVLPGRHRAGAWRLSRHRAHRHDEGPLCQLRRRPRVLLHRLLLYEEPRGGALRAPVHPHGEVQGGL